MPSITTHRELQTAQTLPFCYMCGQKFSAGEKRHRDHVPPKACFATRDREPLVLDSHYACNNKRSSTDKQIGQLIGLKHEKVPKRGDRALKFRFFQGSTLGAVVNVDILGEVWRWIRAFHAALYREPFPNGARGSLVTPFPSAPIRPDGCLVIDEIKPQHAVFVETIKLNRAKQNLDTIRCNKGKLVYECVWCPSDDGSTWLCIFAVDIYGWKDLGETGILPARGCAGFYTLLDGGTPLSATKGVTSSIIVPNFDRLDPFGQ